MAPLDRLSGDLTHLEGSSSTRAPVATRARAAGIFLSADEYRRLTGTLGLGTVSGFGMTGAITYSATDGTSCASNSAITTIPCRLTASAPTWRRSSTAISATTS
ncbi:MAG: hypothetical protein MZV64_15740 [Ignavibacteriales bacterium]|nr:hypothetical protein [Ignavibacteriales bacterium]